MQNVVFLKEAITQAQKNVTLCIINQKQLKDAINFTITSLIESGKRSVVLISLTAPAEQILSEIKSQNKNWVSVIDMFSREESEMQKNIIKISNPGDLTGIQIALEKTEKMFPEKNIILFDAINALEVHSKRETVAKFFHMFNNKVRLEEESAILFTVKDSTDPQLLEMLKEFADKVYDYSDMFISTISLAEQIL